MRSLSLSLCDYLPHPATSCLCRFRSLVAGRECQPYIYCCFCIEIFFKSSLMVDTSTLWIKNDEQPIICIFLWVLIGSPSSQGHFTIRKGLAGSFFTVKNAPLYGSRPPPIAMTR